MRINVEVGLMEEKNQPSFKITNYFSYSYIRQRRH
jgi:hypothetical protein